MNKIFKFSLVTMFIGCLASNGGIINWGSGQVLHDNNDNLLPGHRDRDDTTGFIQLLHLGGDDTYDGITPSGSGVLGNDTVISQSWVGDGNSDSDGFRDSDGLFSGNDTNQTWPSADPYTSGEDSFVIRVFDTAVSDADWGDGMVQDENDNWVLENPGNIPTTGYYGYSKFLEPVKDAEGEYTLLIEDYFATNQAVPEPSSFLLLLLAGITLLFRRKRIFA